MILCYPLCYLIYVAVLLSDIGDALEMSRCELSSEKVDWQNCDKVESLARKSIKALKIKRFVDIKSPSILLFSVGLRSVDGALNQYKFAVPLFGAANGAPIIGTTILYYFSITNVSIFSV